jgi:hypothetical protein
MEVNKKWVGDSSQHKASFKTQRTPKKKKTLHKGNKKRGSPRGKEERVLWSKGIYYEEAT